jgi:exopolysaccharide production protein ExoQ
VPARAGSLASRLKCLAPQDRPSLPKGPFASPAGTSKSPTVVEMKGSEGLKTFAFYACLAVGLGIAAFLLAGGTPLRIGLACAAALLPLAGYLTLVRPMLFPYAFYVLLIPFDNLLNFSGSGTLTKFLGMATGIVLFFYCLRIRRVVSPPPTLFILGIFLFWMVLSVSWAADQQNALSALAPYLGLALLYAALALTPLSVRDFRLLLFVVVAGGIASAAFGIHVFHDNPLLTQQDNPLLRRLVVQVGNTTVDPNQFADALLFPIAALAMFGVRTKWISLKLVSLAGIGLMLDAIFLSGSREAIITVGVIFVYYLWRSRHRLQFFALALLAAIVGMANSGSLLARFSNAISTGGAGRTSVWKVGWETFKHNWLFGYGIGSFPASYDRYYLSVSQIYPDGWTRPAHNLLFHYGVELGIIGLALLVWFCVAQFLGLRDIDRSSPFYDYRVMLEGALLGVFVASMFIDLFSYKYAWLVFAMVVQLRSIAMVQGSRAPARAKPGGSVPSAPLALPAPTS